MAAITTHIWSARAQLGEGQRWFTRTNDHARPVSPAIFSFDSYDLATRYGTTVAVGRDAQDPSGDLAAVQPGMQGWPGCHG